MCVNLCILLQIRLAVAEAIGFAVHLLSQEQLNNQLPSLVHCVLSLYKKHSDHYYISQVCVCACMSSCVMCVLSCMRVRHVSVGMSACA